MTHDKKLVLEQAYHIWLLSQDPLTGRHSYEDVYPLYEDYLPGTPQPSIRRDIINHHRAQHPDLFPRKEPPAPEVYIDPVLFEDVEAMGEALWEAHEKRSSRAIEKHWADPHRIIFDSGPICITAIADPHIGGDGSDYFRMRSEAEIVANTPGMYCFFVGDLTNNFVVGRLKDLNMHTDTSIESELIMAEHYIRILAPKLLCTVGGNHDNWTTAVSGIDQLKGLNDLAGRIANRTIPYDPYKLDVDVVVGDAVFAYCLKHEWRGNSEINALHDIQKGARMDDSRPFRIGIGAHKHRGAVSGFFVHDGETRLAQNCSTYKVIDPYAKAKGFPQNNGGTTVSAILTERGTIIVPETLEDAVEIMNLYYRDL